MAVTIDPSSAPAPAPSASVLASLRAYVRLVETRRSVQAEMDQALGSFLTATPAALARGGADPLSAGAAAEEAESVSGRGGAGTGTGTGTGVGSERGSDAGAPLSTCAAEAIRPPNEAELQQVLQIAFGGLVEVKEHARIIVAELEDRWDREDLARMVRAVEEDESKRIKLVSLSVLRLSWSEPALGTNSD